MQHDGIFVVCDLETADEVNSYICSIGLAMVINGQVQKTTYSLINPNCDFCERNTKIHGITKGMVADAPTFSEFWSKVGIIFEKAIIVAHNAHFDLSVIKKELVRNNIQIDNITYVDTLQVARKCLNLEHYGLSDVCKALNINLENHHCALDDCVATANMLIKLLDKYDISFNDFIKQFSVSDKGRELMGISKSKSGIHIEVDLQPKFNFFSKCPQNIDLQDTTVCLSGDFGSMSKSEFANILDSKGAVVKKAVIKSLEYLVIGEQGSEQWAHGSFETKIEKALKFNCNGSNILIVKEQDFLECSNMLRKQIARNVSENILYIAPKGEWHNFESTEEIMIFLKNHNMLAPTAVELKNIYYNGVFTDRYTLCEVCGYIDDTIAVIKLNDNLHCIDIDCLRDMQPTKAEKEKQGLL